MEVHLIEGLGTSDNDPVVPKEESAECGDKCDGPEIAEMKIGAFGGIRRRCKGRCTHGQRTTL